MRAVLSTARFWAPFLGGFVLLLIAREDVGSLVSFGLWVVACGLILDGATALWARNGSAGNLTTHRQ